VEDAVHWRLIVVDDGVVAGYRNRKDFQDFRTYADNDPGDFTAPVRADMAALAVQFEMLVHPQRRHGIDPHRAACRQEVGQRSGGDHGGNRQAPGHGIEGRNPIEQSA